MPLEYSRRRPKLQPCPQVKCFLSLALKSATGCSWQQPEIHSIAGPWQQHLLLPPLSWPGNRDYNWWRSGSQGGGEKKEKKNKSISSVDSILSSNPLMSQSYISCRGGYEEMDWHLGRYQRFCILRYRATYTHIHVRTPVALKVIRKYLADLCGASMSPLTLQRNPHNLDLAVRGSDNFRSTERERPPPYISGILVRVLSPSSAEAGRVLVWSV